MKEVTAKKKIDEIKKYFPDCFIIQVPLSEEKILRFYMIKCLNYIANLNIIEIFNIKPTLIIF